MADLNDRVGVRLGPRGRLEIPAHFRKALSLEPGQDLECWIEGDRLVFRGSRPDETDLLARFEGIEGWSDSLIRERRREAGG